MCVDTKGSHRALLGRCDGDGCVDEQVLQLEGLDQVAVPDHAAVSNLQRANVQTSGSGRGVAK